MSEEKGATMQGDSTIVQAFDRFEKLLSTQKARECLKKAEESFAFDTEIFLQPVRQELGECMELVAALIKERGALSDEVQPLIPMLNQWLDPGKNHAQEVARLEKHIADKKKTHPDFVYAFKLQILVRRYEEILQDESLDQNQYGEILKKYEQAKLTLSDHMQTKIRIAQRAFAPEMLELAQAQLQLAKHHEKLLHVKNEILNSAQKHAKSTLETLANIFKDAEPELADTILTQTRALATTGSITNLPKQHEVPHNLSEFKQALEDQKDRINHFSDQLQECREKLNQLIEFEDAIFNTYGDQLRSKGIHFKKPTKNEKTGIGSTSVKYRHKGRMVRKS